MPSATVSRLLDLPPVRWARRRRFDRRFATPAGGGACRGVYASFAEAAESVPTRATIGYDTQDAAAMYRDRLNQVYAADYPVLYWLQRWLTAEQHVVDLGGHVGVSYYAFRPLLPEVPSLHWHVHDVPAVMASGRVLAGERGATELSFSEELATVPGVDLFLAAGSLQYLEPSLGALLRRLPALPKRVIVNKTPTHPRHSFVTLQHIGVSYCPYRIHSADALEADLAPLGYRCLDQWDNPDLTCVVPFERDAGPITYRGFAFERDDATAATG
jgi:putative methyltransferase (TIGR04325 family)